MSNLKLYISLKCLHSLSKILKPEYQIARLQNLSVDTSVVALVFKSATQQLLEKSLGKWMAHIYFWVHIIHWFCHMEVLLIKCNVYGDFMRYTFTLL